MTRIHSVAGTLAAGLGARPGAAVPGAAPRRVRGRDHRRRDGPAARRGQPRASRRAAPRRAAGVHARGARGAAPAARGRRRLGRARRRPRALPRAIPARRDDEPLPVRRARRSAARVRVHPRQDHRLPREGLARAARPLRPRGRDAAAAGGGARGGPGRVVGRRADARGRRRGTAPLGASRAARRPRPSFSTAPSTGCRSRGADAPASRASRGPSRRSPGSADVLPEHVAEALSYRSPTGLASP